MSRRARTAQRKATQADRRAALQAQPQHTAGEGLIVAGAELRAPAHLDLPSRDLYPGDASFDPDNVNPWLQHRLSLTDWELHHAQPTPPEIRERIARYRERVAGRAGLAAAAIGLLQVIHHCPDCGGELQDGAGSLWCVPCQRYVADAELTEGEPE